MIKKAIGCWSLIMLALISVWSQCKDPFVPSFSERSSTSIKISWLDNNASPLGFQLAHAEKGTPITQALVSPVLNTKNATLTGLIPGTTYSFWIRTICAPGDTSKWAGPYGFTTYITNPSPCEMKIDIKDNSCRNNTGDQFFIEVDLGNNSTNLVLQSVSLIIQHTWPADLKIDLESPWGQMVTLSQYNGTISDNFGVINGSCTSTTTFSDEACASIKEGKPPFAGNFIPENPLSTFDPSSQKNGLWKLRICDDAFNDKGILRFVSLNFVPFSCSFVNEYYVSRVNKTSFEVRWVKPDHCLNMEISYRKKGNAIFDKKKIINCDSLKTTIGGLEADTEYEFVMTSNCGMSNLSSPSCLSAVKTQCQTPLLYENFDGFDLCEPSCATPCPINSFVENDILDDTDWIVYKDATPTEFTGPSAGAFDGGHYLYVESNPVVCDSTNLSRLTTRCLKTSNEGGVCDLSFFYHMEGADIGKLLVEKSLNEKDWDALLVFEGHQSENWITAVANLALENDTYFKLRFTAETKNGIQGDIGLDEISISNATISDPLVHYYDQDGDGFGDEDSTLVVCGQDVPLNFTLQNGDCNDRNPNVNPNQDDIPCNLVDENCDGVIELENVNNPIVIVSSVVTDVSCAGKSDGSIAISLTGGNPPYQYFWNNNEVIEDIENIAAGQYFCRITDVNGCGIISDTFEVKTISEYSVQVSNIIQPSCFGKSDATVTISHNSAFPPFIYQWSNGATSQNLTMAGTGVYAVSVTDQLGCVEILKDIELHAEEAFNGLTSFIKQPFCFGQTTGVIEVQGFNGVAPYSYLWENGNTGNKVQNLGDGVYQVTITDQRGCKVIYEDEIKAPQILDVKLLNVEPARCFGSKTGVIKTKTTGGTPPYFYQWLDGGPPIEIRTNLNAGLYKVTVSDINGCSDKIDGILLVQPTELKYTIDSVVSSSCLAKKDGAIFTSVTGGIMPYQFFWSGTEQHEADADSLLPGNYTLTVLDANQCKLTTEAQEVLFTNVAYDVQMAVIQDNACPGENKGIISATSTSQAYPLDFNWSNGSQHFVFNSKDTLNDLKGGNYNVTITDAEGCVSISDLIQIKMLNAFVPTLQITQNFCKEDTLGEIKLSMAGGSPPYTYRWNNGNATAINKHLSNGNYWYEVMDDKDCIFQSPPIPITSVSNLNCTITTTPSNNSENTGSWNILPTGGVGGYTIRWNTPGLIGFNLQNLASGTYSFTLTDNLMCELDSFVTIDLINSVEGGMSEELMIAPNPNMGSFLIKGLNASDIKQISATNISGMPIGVHWVRNKDVEVKLESAEDGVYFIHISTLDKIFIKKIVVIN